MIYRRVWTIIWLLAAAYHLTYYWTHHNLPEQGAVKPRAEVTTDFAVPIDGFWDRITKKPFGIYITPKTSPVQPERFTGFHTAVDVEYGDTDTDVPIYAIADGKVVVSRTASGYGGVLVIAVQHPSELFAIYGHVDVKSIPPVGTEVTKGEVIGKLGKAYSVETDGERKHLHFGIINQPTPNIAGYVKTQSELSGWIDPKAVLISTKPRWP